MSFGKSDYRVLLVDDDEDEFIHIRDLLGDLPKGKKYHLTWKSTYQDGLQALKEHSFDACLLDYRLGAQTGLDLLRESRDLSLDVPFILLTGHGDLEVDMEALRFGAADYLVKGQLTGLLLDRAVRYSVKHVQDLKELSEQAESFKTLFNSTFEGILVHDQGLVMDSNAGALDIFGYTPEQMNGMQLLQLVQPADHDRFQNHISKPTRERIELRAVKANGSELLLELSSRSVILKGKTVSLMAVRDLSERKQMEAQILQQDRLASLGLLASSLAHEIGTPMAVIRGRAEMVLNQASENLKPNLTIIISQIDRISKLVTSLLQLARGTQTQDALCPVEVLPVIEDVVRLMNHEVELKGIKLETSIVDHPMVLAEAGPLGQVLLNLLVNSVYAIGEAQNQGRRSGHEIRIQVQEKKDHYELTVSDTGVGISENNLRQLFKPFFTTKDIGVGTGLGLATSYKLIQSWGGNVRVESRVDQGTSFFIHLRKPAHPHSRMAADV